MAIWQIDHRRAFIEHCVFWRARLRLGDLVDVFGISRTQASLDVNAYIADHPDHLVYDKSRKYYVPGPSFAAHYTSLEPSDHLGRLLAMAGGAQVPRAEWELRLPAIHATPVPARGMQAVVLRDLLLAIDERRALTILYQSMSAPDPAERVIVPHALAHDGFRWHTRALCARDGVFKDFVISRMRRAALGEVAEVDPASDTDWTTEVTLRIGPHPALSPAQAQAIALDYGIEHGTAEIRVRRSMLYYTLKRLGLDTDPDTRRPQDQQIVLLNRAEVIGLTP
jgi:hypothetical protein